jgi:UDP:flavonoid glycosyltransferase YjiC (YdhE family)
LGHATRCIPIVEALLKLGIRPKLAGSGASLAILRDHFPQLAFRTLPAYNVRFKHFYSLIPQLPRLWSVVRKERRLLHTWLKEGWVDAVISDNRYGLWHSSVPTAFVCHQLAPLPPFGGDLAHWLSYTLHSRFLRHMNQLWIPDQKYLPNLSGKLSHQFDQRDPRLRWLGPLSRYTDFDKKESNRTWSVVVLLSGPEPQRSLLENTIVPQLVGLDRSALLIQGLKGNRTLFEEKIGYTRCNYLGGEALAHALYSADVVIARPGYSSLMDFAALGLRQLILIPTPGQTEQQYLARRLAEAGSAYIAQQKRFSLRQALKAVDNMQGLRAMESNGLDKVVRDFVGNIKEE